MDIEYTVVVKPDGGREWFLDGNRHHVGGPAVEHANGGREWWVHGLLHREDGPAYVRADGKETWAFHGWHLTESEHTEQVANEARIREIVVIDGVGYKLTRVEGAKQ
jgi:hypothetical protein